MVSVYREWDQGGIHRDFKLYNVFFIKSVKKQGKEGEVYTKCSIMLKFDKTELIAHYSYLHA